MESSPAPATPAVPRWLPPGAALAAAGWGANQFTPLAAVYRTQEQWHPVLVAVLFTAYLPGLLPGLLLVARLAGRASGMAGLALLEPGTAEVRRVFVRPSARGERGGSALMAAVDAAAGALGATKLVLDTRHDLVESHRLYERHGFTRTEAYHEGPYAERWYTKRLAPAAG